MSVRKRVWKTGDGAETVRLMVDVPDANGNRERKQFATRKEAEIFRKDIESQVRAGTFRAEAAKVSVTDAATSFLKRREGQLERGERMTTRNHKVMEGHVWNYIRPDQTRHKADAKKKGRRI